MNRAEHVCATVIIKHNYMLKCNHKIDINIMLCLLNSIGHCQLSPRYEGQLTRLAEPIPLSGQSSSYSLTTLSSSSSTDRRAETDRMVITTRIAVAHHFRCRLRRRESCILGATSSQPTLPLHELPPARLVIYRQTSAHE